MALKAGSLTRSIKVINLQPGQPRNKERQITYLRDERKGIPTDPMDIKKIIKKCYEQFNAYKFGGDLDEVDRLQNGQCK